MNEKIIAEKNKQLKFDDKGFFVILLDRDKQKIIVEHYLNVEKEKGMTGKLNKIIEGTNAEELCHTIIREGLISRLDHASYLGRELQKAEISLKSKIPYEQDGELEIKE